MLNKCISLLQEVLQNIKLPDADGKSPTIAINLVLQFLFYELRYRTDVRKWFYRKLSLELDELLTKTTTGKLFDKLSVSVEEDTKGDMQSGNNYYSSS